MPAGGGETTPAANYISSTGSRELPIRAGNSEGCRVADRTDRMASGCDRLREFRTRRLSFGDSPDLDDLQAEAGVIRIGRRFAVQEPL
jgi:hypothetical protein